MDVQCIPISIVGNIRVVSNLFYRVCDVYRYILFETGAKCHVSHCSHLRNVCLGEINILAVFGCGMRPPGIDHCVMRLMCISIDDEFDHRQHGNRINTI